MEGRGMSCGEIMAEMNCPPNGSGMLTLTAIFNCEPVSISESMFSNSAVLSSTRTGSMEMRENTLVPSPLRSKRGMPRERSEKGSNTFSKLVPS
jgi:hypothetical protein